MPLLESFEEKKKNFILDHSSLSKSFAVAWVPAAFNMCHQVLFLSRYILTDRHVFFSKSGMGKKKQQQQQQQKKNETTVQHNESKQNMFDIF